VREASTGGKLVFALAAFVASLSWQAALAGTGAALHHRLSPRARTVTVALGAAIILALALRTALAA
jgi:arginine exporter protein ArgO